MMRNGVSEVRAKKDVIAVWVTSLIFTTFLHVYVAEQNTHDYYLREHHTTFITYLLIPETICHKDIHSCSKQLTTVTAGQVGYAPKTFTHKYLKIRVQFISPSSPDVPPAAAA